MVGGRSLRSGRLGAGSACGCRLRRSLWTGKGHVGVSNSWARRRWQTIPCKSELTMVTMFGITIAVIMRCLRLYGVPKCCQWFDTCTCSRYVVSILPNQAAQGLAYRTFLAHMSAFKEIDVAKSTLSTANDLDNASDPPCTYHQTSTSSHPGIRLHLQPPVQSTLIDTISSSTTTLPKCLTNQSGTRALAPMAKALVNGMLERKKKKFPRLPS